MISTETNMTAPIVFPHVYFTNIEGKEFVIHRDRILHSETYCQKDENGYEVLDPDKTFVNFVSPNHKSKGTLHAIINMPLKVFRESILRIAYEGHGEHTT